MSFIKDKHDILEGIATIVRTSQSGDVWQLRMYIRDEKKHFKRSLRTKDLDTAKSRARDEALKILSDISSGRKIFAAKLEEIVNSYIEYRSREVGVENGISAGRLVTIKSQLNHLLEIKGAETNVSTLNHECLFDYRIWRKEKRGARDVTIRNEQATFNHLAQWAFRLGLLHFARFNFARIRIRQKDIGKRDTFTLGEYDELIGFMRSWVSKKHCADDVERHRRLIIRDYVLISSNSLLRVGEARQLVWSDLKKITLAKDSLGRNTKFAHLHVRWETSKVRNNRQIVCRGGDYFERLRAHSYYTNDDDLIFCFDAGDKQISARHWALYWRELMDGIGLSDWKARNLTWYSLRHFGITMRIKAGVNVLDLSKMAGTSISHIENTYLKYSEEMAMEAAMKNFSFSKEGIDA